MGVESAVFVAVSAQVPQQCRHLVPFPAVAKFGSRPSGEVLQEIYFTSILEIVRYVGDRLFVPIDIFDKGSLLDDGGMQVYFLHVFPNLAVDFRIGKTYGTFRPEIPAVRLETERVQVSVIRFPDKEPVALHAGRRQAFQQFVITFLRNFMEGLAKCPGITLHKQCHAYR